ncbi:MAG: LapA family protein [Proteobacteria bacterium]|nr:LapA family protein [Pseudomonadota bacterium]MBU1639247.1 LapA family protein [Pseudomonadota bacterium]
MSKVKITLLMVILILVVVFTLQNTEQVDIKFLLWHLSLSRALMLFLVFTVGMLTGFVLNMLKTEGKNDTEPDIIDQ